MRTNNNDQCCLRMASARHCVCEWHPLDIVSANGVRATFCLRMASARHSANGITETGVRSSVRAVCGTTIPALVAAIECRPRARPGHDKDSMRRPRKNGIK
eukprot:559017-Prorocentrum_minimum.AAC.1